MPLFNGEQMRKKLEENLKRLQIQAQLQTPMPAVQMPIERPTNAEQDKS